ncbi:MAG: YggS family pyridoxal phosphate-dependent enzyme [Burkholderiaceae bacterium]
MNGKTNTEESALLALQRIHQRIDAAIKSASRPAGSVHLLAVSKTFAAPNIVAMADAGQQSFGENYLQEALDKQAAIHNERPDLKLEWHFIGPVQSNKTRPIAENFDWVHTVEREKVATRLNDQRPDNAAPLNVCIQINIDGAPSKSGCLPDQVQTLAIAICALPRLRLRGLMAIPDPSDNPDQQHQAFAAVREQLNQLRNSLATQGINSGAVDTLSMGMTADLEAAIAEGATIVRIGTALFGQRTKPAP